MDTNATPNEECFSVTAGCVTTSSCHLRKWWYVKLCSHRLSTAPKWPKKKRILINPKLNMNVYTKFHGNQCNSYQGQFNQNHKSYLCWRKAPTYVGFIPRMFATDLNLEWNICQKFSVWNEIVDWWILPFPEKKNPKRK